MKTLDSPEARVPRHLKEGIEMLSIGFEINLNIKGIRPNSNILLYPPPASQPDEINKGLIQFVFKLITFRIDYAYKSPSRISGHIWILFIFKNISKESDCF